MTFDKEEQAQLEKDAERLAALAKRVRQYGDVGARTARDCLRIRQEILAKLAQLKKIKT